MTPALVLGIAAAAGCVANALVIWRMLRPQSRRAHHLEVASQAVAAAEQRYREPKSGADRARYARQHLMDTLKVSPHQADVLVEHAIARARK